MPLDDAGRAMKYDLLVRILENDALTRDLAIPQLARLGELLGRMKRQQTLLSAYGYQAPETWRRSRRAGQRPGAAAGRRARHDDVRRLRQSGFRRAPDAVSQPGSLEKPARPMARRAIPARASRGRAR